MTRASQKGPERRGSCDALSDWAPFAAARSACIKVGAQLFRTRGSDGRPCIVLTLIGKQRTFADLAELEAYLKPRTTK